jgi:hypothetical protein
MLDGDDAHGLEVRHECANAQPGSLAGFSSQTSLAVIS